MDAKHRRRGVTLVELIVVALLLAVLTIILLPIYLQQVDKARSAAVKSDVRSIQVAVLSYSLDHQDVFPQPATVCRAGLHQYLDPWPSNPWTGTPMVDSSRYVKGDFHYEVLDGGTSGGGSAGSITPAARARESYGLLGYLADPGAPFVAQALHGSAPSDGTAVAAN